MCDVPIAKKEKYNTLTHLTSTMPAFSSWACMYEKCTVKTKAVSRITNTCKDKGGTG